MGNECRISELTKKKLAVKLTTGNQEREFIRICNQNEITIVRRNKEEGKNLQLPIWYALTLIGINNKQAVAWWSVTKPEGYMSVNVRAFGVLLND